MIFICYVTVITYCIYKASIYFEKQDDTMTYRGLNIEGSQEAVKLAVELLKMKLEVFFFLEHVEKINDMEKVDEAKKELQELTEQILLL